MFGRKAEVLREIRREQDPSALRQLFDECRARGWLADGSLAGINLTGVDLSHMELQGADLSRSTLVNADLRRADLHHAALDQADLSGADLSDADLREATFENALLGRVNLRGAKVRDEQLSIAETLNGATMPDGQRYDGRFELPGDLADARRAWAYPDNAEKMAGWYEISQAQLEAGHEWAEENLARTRQAGFTSAGADVDWLAEARADGRLVDGTLRGEDLSEIICHAAT